jgi:hypothetical protein
LGLSLPRMAAAPHRRPVTQALAAWTRRPTTAVARLAGRELLLLSSRDLLNAAKEEDAVLVAFAAPSASAMAGIAHAARDCDAPLLLLRPSGAAEEPGPQESRDDDWFIDMALRAALEVGFRGPMALLKEPPRAGCAVSARERVLREVQAGFTGLSVSARVDDPASVRDAALGAAEACQLELGLEVIPMGGGLLLGAEIAALVRARGAPPSALRLTGHEEEVLAFEEALEGVVASSASEALAEELGRRGVHQLVAAGPFLRALQRSSPPEVWSALQAYADEKGCTLEQAAASHQRLLRDLAPESQERLEALASFEAAEVFEAVGARGTGARLEARVASFVAREQ